MKNFRIAELSTHVKKRNLQYYYMKKQFIMRYNILRVLSIYHHIQPIRTTLCRSLFIIPVDIINVNGVNMTSRVL